MHNLGNESLTLSVENTAKILCISRGLCYEMVRQGKIPSLRFGKVIRIPRYALERLLKGELDSIEDGETAREEV